MHVEIQSEKTKANEKEKRTFKTKTITDPPPFPPAPKQNFPPEFLLIGYIAKSFKKHHVIVNMPFLRSAPRGASDRSKLRA